MKKLKATEMEDFSSVKKVILRLKDDLSTSSGGTSSKTYQGVEVIKLDQSLTFFSSKYKLTSILYWIACTNDLRIALLMLPHLLMP